MDFVSETFAEPYRHEAHFLVLLSRLIGVGASPSKRQAANNPQQRLNRFKRIYSHTLQTWHKLTSGKPDLAAEQSIPLGLEKLTNLLREDTRTPPPQLCLAFASSSHVYIGLARVALSLRANESVVCQTLAFFTILVDSDEEDLVQSERFAENLTTFVDRLIGARADVAASPEVEEKALELIFSIAAKIRLEPHLLPVWFRTDSTAGNKIGNVESSTPPEEGRITFPLCYQFVGHVHSEGRAGDFARTGLLYLFECASVEEKLESWIVESDLPTLMASGLGALYSQLARKLAIAYPQEELPLILALSDNEKRDLPDDVESFYSQDLQSRLSTFMSYFVFWQDVLEHCRSEEIKQTLIEHFQVFFLQQILYPSLLESSDIDGGSSVAVLTYLWRILDSVLHPDLIHLILHYLLALQESPSTTQAAATSNSVPPLKRRKSLFDSTNLASNDDRMNPSFFNLVDMILTSVQSSNPQTITGALRLLAVILSKHHNYAISTLLRTIPVREAASPRPIGALDQEMKTLLVLAHQIGGPVGVDESFESSLKDAMHSVESHSCSRSKLKLPGQDKSSSPPTNGLANPTDKLEEMQNHFLDPDSPLFRHLLQTLETFLTNDIEVNLSVTNVFSQLASCPFCRLDKWLAMDAMKFPHVEVPDAAAAELPDTIVGGKNEAVDEIAEQDRLEGERLQKYQVARQLPLLSGANTPSLIKTLQSLHVQLQKVRTEFPEFDNWLAGRKRAFQGATEIENEVYNTTPYVLTPRLSSEMSRESSMNRQNPPSRTNTPTKLPPTAPETPLNPQRGRALSALIGQLGTPKSSPRPTDKVYRPSPLQSPSLRPRERSPRSSRSPSKAPRTVSPLKTTHFPPPPPTGDMDGAMPSTPVRPSSRRRTTAASAEEEEEIFEKKIHFSASRAHRRHSSTSSSHDDDDDDANGGENEGENAERVATLTHVLTNTVILQDFILELAAIIQTRAGLLDGEVRFL